MEIVGLLEEFCEFVAAGDFVRPIGLEGELSSGGQSHSQEVQRGVHRNANTIFPHEPHHRGSVAVPDGENQRRRPQVNATWVMDGDGLG